MYREPIRMDVLTLADYRTLSAFRYELRRFLAFSEESARQAGLEPQQHQLLLAIKGLPAGLTATIGTLAERLQLHHQSVVELIDRLEEKGFVVRHREAPDRRVVIVALSDAGGQALAPLASAALQQLSSHGYHLLHVLRDIVAQVTPY
jgi:DNA-binding MarR family transcriptional regulator